MNLLRVLALAAGFACGISIATEAPVALRFAEMYVRPVGPAGLEGTALLRSLHGRGVRLVGYLAKREAPGPLILAPVPVTLGEEDEGLADDLPATAVFVHLAPAFETAAVPHRPGLVSLAGTLELGPRRESDGRISSVRLRLDEAASRALLEPSLPSR